MFLFNYFDLFQSSVLHKFDTYILSYLKIEISPELSLSFFFINYWKNIIFKIKIDCIFFLYYFQKNLAFIFIVQSQSFRLYLNDVSLTQVSHLRKASQSVEY